MDLDGHWTQLTRFEDGIVSLKFGADLALYLLSRKDAPRGQILRLPLVESDHAQTSVAKLDLAEAKVVVPSNLGRSRRERPSFDREFQSHLWPSLCD